MREAGLFSMIQTKPLEVVCADTVLKIVSANQDVPASNSNLYSQGTPNH